MCVLSVCGEDGEREESQHDKEAQRDSHILCESARLRARERESEHEREREQEKNTVLRVWRERRRRIASERRERDSER